MSDTSERPPHNRPKVQLEWGYMWCHQHLLAFKATWPLHAGVAMVNLLTASAADDRICAAAQGDTNRLEPVLREFGPMCCYLPPAVVEAVVKASLEGRQWLPESPPSTEEGHKR